MKFELQSLWVRSRALLISLAVVALLLFVKLGVEETVVGRVFERETYGFLSRNAPGFGKGAPAVIVVDIGHLPGGMGAVGQPPVTTSREHLRELVDAIMLAEPLAIGIDIDFSPNRQGWIDERDPAFLDHCLRLNARVPIRVGVFRGLREAREAWLGLPEFAPLAGAIWPPAEGARRLPIAIEGRPGSALLPSLGAALAAGVAPGKDLLAHPLSFALAQVTTREAVFELHGAPIRIHEAIVNYAFLEQFDRETIVAATPGDIAKYADRIKNRVVLIGDLKAGSPADSFPVAGIERDQRGVLLHAALVNTLIANPLSELSHTARIVLDVVIGVVIGAVVLHAARRGKVAAHRAERRAVWLAVLVVLLGGLALSAWFRIMWMDFFLVLVFVLLHPAVHAWFPHSTEHGRHAERSRTDR